MPQCISHCVCAAFTSILTSVVSLLSLQITTMVKESLPSWVHQDSDEGLVHVNVGGLKRSLCSSTLKKFPDTRLGKLLACDSEEDILQVGGLRGQTNICHSYILLQGAGVCLSVILLLISILPSLCPPVFLPSCRCAMTMTCSRRSFILIGIPASSHTSSTSTRRANSTSWRSCVSSPSGLSLSV